MDILGLLFTNDAQWTVKDTAITVGMVVGILLLLRGSTRRIRGKGALTKSQARQRAVPLADQVEIQSRLEKLLVELQDMARQVNAGIDTRFCKLEVLMREADGRIKQLEALSATGGKETEGLEEKEGGSKEAVDPDREVIYKLAAMGKGAVEIAQELKKHPGEVELILSLRRAGGEGGQVDYTVE